jgi:AhpD family alkylhydroperoxidase
MAKLPRAFQAFQRRYSKVFNAYETLGGVAHEGGPLDAKTRELVKLGMAIGGRLEGAVRSHAHRAIEAGATPSEIEHVILLAITTSGFPTAVAAFTWVEKILSGRRGKR